MDLPGVDSLEPPASPSARVRGTVVSPDEVIAFILESSRPVAIKHVSHVAPQRRHLTISDPLDIVFGMVHELSFLEDSLDACAFAVRSAHTFLPSRSILVHLFDRARDEFVLAHVQGPSALAALVGHRTPARDALFQMALDEKRTKHVVEAPDAPGILRERHVVGGGRSSVVAHPVVFGGETFAMLEVVDPEIELEERQLVALTYLADRLAEFFADHPYILPVPVPQQSGTICYHCMDGVEHECRGRSA